MAERAVDGVGARDAVNSPYASAPLDAFMAAQTSVGITLSAVILRKPLRPLVASWLMVAAIWLSILWPVIPPFLVGLGLTIPAEKYLFLLKLAAGCITAAAVFTTRPFLVAVAVSLQAGLWMVVDQVTQSEWEVAAAHVCACGLFLGVAWREDERARGPSPSTSPTLLHGFAIDDALLVLVGAFLGAIVSTVVLHRYTNSGDEWGYTWQAAVFAKGRAFATPPRCAPGFQTFWVFEWTGRMFSQYTPGWAYFMTPFMWIRAPWLAGPFSLGVLAAGVARLGRRAFATGGLSPHVPGRASVRAAGIFSAAAVLLGATILINGASRYPHVFVAAMYAWSLESLCVIAEKGLSYKPQRNWGIALGSCAALMLAARPSDGGILGLGLAAYFVIALIRRKIGLIALAATTAAFLAWCGLTLVILRLQLGRWFVTGYSLSTIIYPWNQFKYSWPHPSELKWGLPLGTGSYCWWPCAPALGLAGLAALRGHASRIAFMIVVSGVPFLAFYMYLEMGRGFELGYGPRYQLAMVVAMAVGGGALLAAMWEAATRRSFTSAVTRGGPIALAIAAALFGVVRIAPLVYPHTYNDVMVHNRLHEALRASDVHDAVVVVGGGLNNTSPLDLTENLPLDLYEPGDVVIALDSTPEVNKCVRELFPKRHFYRAIPGGKIGFEPM